MHKVVKYQGAKMHKSQKYTAMCFAYSQYDTVDDAILFLTILFCIYSVFLKVDFTSTHFPFINASKSIVADLEDF
jgi:hypothetical protein